MTRHPLKAIIATFGIWLLLLSMFAGYSAGSTANIIQNGSFEDVTAEFPAKWAPEGYLSDEAVTKYQIDASRAHEGTQSALVENISGNDARWIQRVAVKPSTFYKLSGWIMAEGTDPNKTGANLSVMGSTSASRDIRNSEGKWEYVDLYGSTGPEQTELLIAARLGFYGNENTGKAWFDDIRLEALDSLPENANAVSFDAAGAGQADSGDSSESEAQPATDAGKQLSGMYTRTMILITCIAYVALALFAVRYAVQSGPGTLLGQSAGANGMTASSSIRPETLAFWLIIGMAGVLRLIMAPLTQGFGVDVGTFTAWSMHAYSDGLADFYKEGMFADYPPGYVYVMYVIGFLFNLFGTEPGSAGTLFLLKFPPMVADLLIGWWIYRQIGSRIGSSVGTAFALLYVLNPAVLINSTVWAQVDSAFTIFLAVYLVFLSKREMPKASAFLAIAVLIKPQALIFGLIYLMVFIEWLIRGRREALDSLWRSALIGIGTFLAGIMPFVIQKGVVEQGSFFKGLQFIYEKYTSTLASYPYGSVNAFNIHALFGYNWTAIETKVLGLTLNAWGWVGITLAIGYAIFLFIRGGESRPERIMLVALWLLMAFVTLGPKMHERYLYPAMMISLLVMMFRADRRLLWLFLGITVAHYTNVAYILGNSFIEYIHIRDDGFMTFSSLLHVLMLGAAGWLAYDLLVRRSEGLPLTAGGFGFGGSGQKSDPLLTKSGSATGAGGSLAADPVKPYRWFKAVPVAPWTRTDTILVTSLTVIYAVIAFYNLGSMNAPESFWRAGNPGSSVTADLGESRTVGSVAYFGGLVNGTGKFVVESSADQKQWRHIGTFETTEGGMYQWKSMATSAEGRYFRIASQGASAMLNEAAFVSTDGKTVWPVASVIEPPADPFDQGKPAHIFDEQDTVVLKSSFYDSMYFDEIYHARTAYEHLNYIEPYESTHPPLGKIIISAGVKLFGMNPFGWRVAGTLFGILMVPIMYVFGRRLFGTTRYAFITSLLMTFDFMHFAQTRIATIDVYGVFFILLMYYYMWRHLTEPDDQPKRALKWLALSGLFFGLGAASKWICLYAGAGLGLLWLIKQFEKYLNYRASCRGLDLVGKKQPGLMEQWREVVETYPKQLLQTLGVSVAMFVAVPLIIYAMSYIPFMNVPGPGHELKDVVSYQKHMYNYHSNLVAEHPFASTWYQWPLMTRPIWYYGGSPEEGVVSSITSFGNPAVWWPASLAMLICIGLWIRRKNPVLLFIMIGFGSQFIPWIPVPRLTFIYHFFASVPFIIFALVYVLRLIETNRPQLRNWINGYLLLVIALFALFYPVLSGFPIDREFAKAWLDWFDSQGFDWILFS